MKRTTVAFAACLVACGGEFTAGDPTSQALQEAGQGGASQAAVDAGVTVGQGGGPSTAAGTGATLQAATSGQQSASSSASASTGAGGACQPKADPCAQPKFHLQLCGGAKAEDGCGSMVSCVSTCPLSSPCNSQHCACVSGAGHEASCKTPGYPVPYACNGYNPGCAQAIDDPGVYCCAA